MKIWLTQWKLKNTMLIELHDLKPRYMSESEISGSDIYLQSFVLFEQGRSYMVCAKSGHGKSSLLNFIYGSNTQYDGTIDFIGLESYLDSTYMRTSVLSYLFQDLCLFSELTAMENVQLKNNLTHFKTDVEIGDMLDAILPADKKNQPVATLSLGQRQRVAAVRALCQPFKFILLDEPFSHLDNDNAAAVAKMVSEEVRRQGAGMIVTALDPIDFFAFDKVMTL